MTRPWRRAAIGVALVVVTVVLALDAGLPPTAVEAAAITIAAALALGTAARLPAREGLGPRGRRRRAAAADDVARTRTRLEAAGRNAGAATLLLAPRLSSLARHRCERHGVDLDDPVAARVLLGDDLHALVDPRNKRPRDRDGPGIALDRLAAMVERLESL